MTNSPTASRCSACPLSRRRFLTAASCKPHKLTRATVEKAVEAEVRHLLERIRAGADFAQLAQENVETLKRYRFRKILVTCPHCLNTLKHEYPDFGGKYEVVKGLAIDEFSRGKMDNTLKELLEERDGVKELL